MIALPHPIRSAALGRPEHPALIAGGEVLTAADLELRVRRRARWLAERGLRGSSRVGLLGPPSADWIVDLHALSWLGALAVPLPFPAPAVEREAMIRGARLDLVLADRRAEPQAGDPGVPVLALGAPLHDEPASERFQPLREPRVLLHTSGTTGRPVGVPLSSAQLLLSAFGSALRLGHDPDDTWLCCLPLHHVAGLQILLRCTLYGTTVLLHGRFCPERVADDLDAGRASLISLVPPMLETLLDRRGDRPFPSSLRAILLGGGPTSERLRARCARLKLPVARTWGMTETASQVSTCRPGEIEPEEGSGPPLAFARVESTGGRLRVLGPLTQGGVLVTGDRGRADAKGRIHVEGRADDVIVSGGVNVHPAEIEAVLESHEAIVEARVVAVDDPRWGRRPVAALVPRRAASPPAEQEIRRWCARRLQRFKVPDRFVWCAELPRTALGKRSRAGVASLFGLPEQADPAKTRPEIVRHLELLEGAEVDEGVDQLDAGALHAVESQEPVGEGDGGAPHAVQLHADQDAVAVAHGAAVVRLGVYERHAPGARPQGLREGDAHGVEHLLEGHVAVLEDVAEEHDPGAVDLVEADGEGMLESHGVSGGGARRPMDPHAEESVHSRLAEICRDLGADLRWLGDDLREVASRCPSSAARSARHLLDRPGKRLRPIAALLAARLGPRPNLGAARRMAAAAELVHAATLLHDDVIDEGEQRRHAPASRVLFGNAASVLGGDLLLVEAMARVQRAGVAGALERLLDCLGRMVAAEGLQLDRRGRFELDREACLQVMRGKTAALFSWALAAGGSAGGLSAPQVETLAGVGEDLGVAFQLADDLLDLEGASDTIGKDGWADLREGRSTWPLVLAAERDPAVRSALEAFAADVEGQRDAGELLDLRAHISRTGCVERTRAFAGAHLARARTALQSLPWSEARDRIEGVLDLTVERKL